MMTRMGVPPVGHEATTGADASTSGVLNASGVSFPDHQPPGVSRDGTAGVHQAQVSDFHQAIGPDMLAESADHLDGIEVGGARSCTAGFARRERDGAVLEGDDAAVGDGDLEDRHETCLRLRYGVVTGASYHKSYKSG